MYACGYNCIVLFRDGVGADFWNDSGCSTMNFENGSVMCSCNHLTHFAILLTPDHVRELESLFLLKGPEYY